MPSPFREQLSQGVVLFDGAMATMLYERGAYINQCYEALNLSSASMVSEIHGEYLLAGADVIETNSFGANGVKLKGFGLEPQVAAINCRAAELAREAAKDRALVAGAVGPLGACIKPLGPIGEEEARGFFRVQIQALLEGGVDLLSLESFSDLNELRLAVETARDLTRLPIVAQASFNEKGETLMGTAVETFVCEASGWDLDVIGFNCSSGPADMLALLEKAAALTHKPIICQPNAGMPKMLQGRNFYLTSPEYMAEYAKRFIQSGAAVVGGCCGTEPKHIKAMRAAIRALFPKKRAAAVCVYEKQSTPWDEAPMEKKSRLGERLKNRQFVTTIEITPPRSADPALTLEKCKFLRQQGLDAVNIPDGPRASARLSPMILALLIKQQVGLEVVLHYTCRDRNIIGMQSDLLGAHAAGLRNLLIITGDPPKLGDYPDATAVFDVDSIGLTRLVSSLNQGLDVGGNPIPEPLNFLKGVGVNPGAINLQQELDRLRQKIDAGAEFMITQPVFDPEIFLKFFDRLAGISLPVIAGVWPLVSFKNAEFMNNEVPGASVPAAYMARMQEKGSGPEAQQEGVRIAGEALQRIRGGIQGVQVAAPFGKVELALDVFEAGGIALAAEKKAG